MYVPADYIPLSERSNVARSSNSSNMTRSLISKVKEADRRRRTHKKQDKGIEIENNVFNTLGNGGFEAQVQAAAAAQQISNTGEGYVIVTQGYVDSWKDDSEFLALPPKPAPFNDNIVEGDSKFFPGKDSRYRAVPFYLFIPKEIGNQAEQAATELDNLRMESSSTDFYNKGNDWAMKQSQGTFSFAQTIQGFAQNDNEKTDQRPPAPAPAPTWGTFDPENPFGEGGSRDDGTFFDTNGLGAGLINSRPDEFKGFDPDVFTPDEAGATVILDGSGKTRDAAPDEGTEKDLQEYLLIQHPEDPLYKHVHCTGDEANGYWGVTGAGRGASDGLDYWLNTKEECNHECKTDKFCLKALKWGATTPDTNEVLKCGFDAVKARCGLCSQDENMCHRYWNTECNALCNTKSCYEMALMGYAKTHEVCGTCRSDILCNAQNVNFTMEQLLEIMLIVQSGAMNIACRDECLEPCSAIVGTPAEKCSACDEQTLCNPTANGYDAVNQGEGAGQEMCQPWCIDTPCVALNGMIAMECGLCGDGALCNVNSKGYHQYDQAPDIFVRRGTTPRAMIAKSNYQCEGGRIPDTVDPADLLKKIEFIDTSVDNQLNPNLPNTTFWAGMEFPTDRCLQVITKARPFDDDSPPRCRSSFLTRCGAGGYTSTAHMDMICQREDSSNIFSPAECLDSNVAAFFLYLPLTTSGVDTCQIMTENLNRVLVANFNGPDPCLCPIGSGSLKSLSTTRCTRKLADISDILLERERQQNLTESQALLDNLGLGGTGGYTYQSVTTVNGCTAPPVALAVNYSPYVKKRGSWAVTQTGRTLPCLCPAALATSEVRADCYPKCCYFGWQATEDKGALNFEECVVSDFSRTDPQENDFCNEDFKTCRNAYWRYPDCLPACVLPVQNAFQKQTGTMLSLSCGCGSQNGCAADRSIYKLNDNNCYRTVGLNQGRWATEMYNPGCVALNTLHWEKVDCPYEDCMELLLKTPASSPPFPRYWKPKNYDQTPPAGFCMECSTIPVVMFHGTYDTTCLGYPVMRFRLHETTDHTPIEHIGGKQGVQPIVVGGDMWEHKCYHMTQIEGPVRGVPYRYVKSACPGDATSVHIYYFSVPLIPGDNPCDWGTSGTQFIAQTIWHTDLSSNEFGDPGGPVGNGKPNQCHMQQDVHDQFVQYHVKTSFRLPRCYVLNSNGNGLNKVYDVDKGEAGTVGMWGR